MQSGFERFISDKLWHIRQAIRYRDRAVIVAAGLSFVPVFPACFFGMILSAINLYLIRIGVTSRRELALSKISFIVGLLLSFAWLLLAYILGGMVSSFFWGFAQFPLDLIRVLLNFLKLPIDSPNMEV